PLHAARARTGAIPCGAALLSCVRVTPRHAIPDDRNDSPTRIGCAEAAVARRKLQRASARLRARNRAPRKRTPTVMSTVSKMARPERFELPTAWFVARYSIQLSYGRVVDAPHYECVREERQ